MKNDKEKWMESVFESLKGAERAKPGPDLFAKIESQTFDSEAKVIPIYQLRIAVAVAILLLFFNVIAFNQYAQSSSLNTEDLAAEEATSQSLISNYQLYE